MDSRSGQKKLDLRAGDDKGRIYRVYPEGKQPRPIARLDKLDTAGLVAALDSPNGPQRDLAQQMLIWRNDKAATPLLQRLAGGSSRPQAAAAGSLHAGWPGGAYVGRADIKLLDDHPAVLRHAVRLSEPWLGKDERLSDHVLTIAFDADPTVQMQAAYSLGTWNDDRAARVIGSMLLKNAGDPYLTAAALSSVNKDNVATILAQALRREPSEVSPDTDRVVERLLAMAAAMGQDSAVATGARHGCPAAAGPGLCRLAIHDGGRGN